LIRVAIGFEVLDDSGCWKVVPLVSLMIFLLKFGAGIFPDRQPR
jgi:hypothetical protein